MIKKIVECAEMRGMNVSWNLNIFSAPMFTVRCGECGATFKDRPAMVDYPTLGRPSCGTLNRLPLELSRNTKGA